MVTLNKWQRLIVAVGAIICLFQAFSLWSDDPDDWRPGLTFLGGIALAVLAFTRAAEGEEALPFVRWLSAHKKETLFAVAAVGLATFILVFARPFAVESSYDDFSYEAPTMAETEVQPAANGEASDLLDGWLEQQERKAKESVEPPSLIPDGYVEDYAIGLPRKTEPTTVDPMEPSFTSTPPSSPRSTLPEVTEEALPPPDAND